MGHLGRLPLDTLLEILFCLQPRQIVQGPRQVCHSLHSASTNRALWRNLLRRVCKEENIFAPTFALDQMNDKDLEHAATRPARFLSLLESNNTQESLEVYREQFLNFFGIKHRLIKDTGVRGVVRFMYVVPGGRFLITGHWNMSGASKVWYLNIWDVGWHDVPAQSPAEQRYFTPIATLKDRSAGNLTPVHPTRDGKGLLLFARMDEDQYASFEGHKRIQHFYIYEIYPAEVLPPLQQGIQQDLRQVGKMTLDTIGFEFCCLGYEHLAMISNHEKIMVWNFVDNTSAAWMVPDLDGTDEGDFPYVNAVTLQNNHIVVIRDGDLLIWNIPTLFPCGSARSEDLQTIRPIWSCPLNRVMNPISGEPFYVSVDQLDDWYADSDRPVYFDAVMNTRLAKDPTLPTIYRYQVNVPDSLVDNHGHRVPSETVITQIATFYHPAEPRWEDNRYPKSSRISQGNLVVDRIRDDTKLFIYHHSAVPAPSNDSGASISFLTLPAEDSPQLIEDEEDNYATVCPSSGRIFLYLQRNRDDTTSVRILDLLRHPEWEGNPFSLTVRGEDYRRYASNSPTYSGSLTDSDGSASHSDRSTTDSDGSAEDSDGSSGGSDGSARDSDDESA